MTRTGLKVRLKCSPSKQRGMGEGHGVGRGQKKTHVVEEQVGGDMERDNRSLMRLVTPTEVLRNTPRGNVRKGMSNTEA